MPPPSPSRVPGCTPWQPWYTSCAANPGAGRPVRRANSSKGGLTSTRAHWRFNLLTGLWCGSRLSVSGRHRGRLCRRVGAGRRRWPQPAVPASCNAPQRPSCSHVTVTFSVLIVDDSRSFLDVGRDLLERQGVRVVALPLPQLRRSGSHRSCTRRSFSSTSRSRVRADSTSPGGWLSGAGARPG